MRSNALLIVLLASCQSDGCQGQAEVPAAPDVCALGNEVGRPLLRRLTRAELERTVDTAFGLHGESWGQELLPPDRASQSGFPNQEDQLVVTASLVQAMDDVGASVADTLLRPDLLDSILPCHDEDALACAEAFLGTSAAWLYGRRLTPDEQGRYLAPIEAGDVAFEEWLHWSVRGLLRSPHMLWRSELGTLQPDGETVLLEPWETARDLAYAYSGEPPTTALIEAAERGELSSEAGRQAAARELATGGTQGVTDGFSSTFQDFTSRWLGYVAVTAISKDPNSFPGFDRDLTESMLAETEAFVDEVVLNEGGGITELLTDDRTWVDPVAAEWYGHELGAGPVLRDQDLGAGVLTLGALMSVHSTAVATSPTQRGMLVLERLLCQDVPPPPADIGELPPVEEAETTRERYEDLHTAQPECAQCHVRMDPIGFGMEHIDPVGRYRATENGHEIDATGYLTDVSAVGDGTFDGALELVDLLASTPDVDACFAAYSASWMWGLERHEADCLVDERTLMRGSGLVDRWIDLAGSEHFVRRRASAEPFVGTDGGVLPPPPDPMDDGTTTTTTTDDDCGTVCTALPGAATTDQWCEDNCLHDPPFCPEDLCVCEDVPC